MRNFSGLIALFWLGMIGSCQLALAEGPGKDGVWFHFEADPLGGPGYEKYGVKIRDSGETTVSRIFSGKDLPSYRTVLSGGEMTFVKSLILSVDYFGLPEKVDEPKWTHTTRISLMAKLDEKSRSLSYLNVHRPELKPVAILAMRLVAQAETHDSLVNGRSPSVSFSPRSTGAKVLQPALFREPLKAHIRKIEKGGDVRRDLENLSWITTPEDFVGFYAAEVKRRGLYLCLEAGIPEAHQKALLPFYLMYLREMDARREKPTDIDSWTRRELASRLGTERYAPALPYFVARLDKLEKRGDYVSNFIVRFGYVGVEALIPFLKHKEGFVRETAVGLMKSAVEFNPRKKNRQVGMSEDEYDRMIVLIRNKVLPRLLEMSLSSGGEVNYRYVSKVLSDIEKELAENRKAAVPE